ncbi:hypothetical protein H8K90_10640 [Winogradskyella echinorum]|uniref:Chaperone of endosialidase n=1 Tax=Winogradskyella echinorum TaxID=538189 RepID=A0ABR6Y267_9FLAO|nr:hypothetical protein [Winogradskyella echinorum]MBC3846837.1 hypothetical protein [Winogradskyella echinorum]MBC5751185.1 hypothetical protein [Winogradskyella echinorum]
MKKLIFTVVLSLSFLFNFSQQWLGSNNSSGNIYRTGFVGIGPNATNPSSSFVSSAALLQLKSYGNAEIIFDHTDGNGTSDLGVISFERNSDHLAHIRSGHDGAIDNAFLSFHTQPSGGSYGWINDNEKMRISSNGNVGIGTTNPSELLSVNGKILCEEVEVILDVAPDYVFQKYYTGSSTLKADYVMPTIEEVEAFTKKNHHLPEVPSAKEIKEEGLQLKEMTTLLLQKVEELTLYTIEQEKRIKALEAELAKKQ